jgi:hypothetical protein
MPTLRSRYAGVRPRLAALPPLVVAVAVLAGPATAGAVSSADVSVGLTTGAMCSWRTVARRRLTTST